jgi:hypothetical protein
MKTIELKQEPKYFNAQEVKIKKFELRKNDRDYQVGDILKLKRYHKDWGYLKSFKALSLSKGWDTFYKPCRKEEADTLEVQVKTILTAEQFNQPRFEKEVLDALERMGAEKVFEVLEDFFQTNLVLEDYVLIETEVLE